MSKYVISSVGVAGDQIGSRRREDDEATVGGDGPAIGAVVTLVSPATRLVADDVKTTKRLSADMAAPKESSLAGVPSLATETRVVSPLCRS